MSQDNAFKILVATDNHVGYHEKDPILGNDSFDTFEEILQIAKSQQVDFVLLGGDLFHDNKPSTSCIIRVTELLRKYCYGENKVAFKLVSDQKTNFSHTQNFPYVNFEEENINVSLPVFSIHGNHDDPTGKNHVCQLEALSASGLINYFGKITSYDDINVKPLLLKKNDIQVALFGLGSLSEERLHRSFQKKKVHFDTSTVQKDWFSILVVHQNRVHHGTKYLPEHFLSNIAQLVIWGHEHECMPEPSFNERCGFHVLQPGSSVATSLCPGEAVPKHVILLEIGKNSNNELGYLTKPIPLKTVRPFYFKHLNLDEYAEKRAEKLTPQYVEKVCVEHIEDMIGEAFNDRSGDARQPVLPLLRLRVESVLPIPFSLYTFGHQFNRRAANPREILRWRVKRKRTAKGTHEDIDTDGLASLTGEACKINIEDVVSEIFHSDEKNRLSLVSERGLSLSVREMVEKESSDSIENYLTEFMGKVKKHLMSIDELTIDDKDDMIEAIEKHRLKVEADEKDSIPLTAQDKDASNVDIDVDSDDDLDQESSQKAVSQKTNDRKRKVEVVEIDTSDEESSEEERPAKSRRSNKSSKKR